MATINNLSETKMEHDYQSTFNPKEYPYLPLKVIESWEDEAESLGVSEVARSRRGFLTAYKKAGGNYRRLPDEWRRKRAGFIARHMAQVDNNDEPLLTSDGLPTRRLLALMMWAFSPIKVNRRRNGDARYNGDRDIRDLERRGEDDDYAQARLLREKVRAGLLTEDRLVMAARLGHEAARLAAPEWESLGEIILIDDRSFSLAIDAMSHREKVSLACECVERLISIFEQARPGDVRPRRAIEAAKAWIISPSEKMASNASASDRAASAASFEVESASRAAANIATAAAFTADAAASETDYNATWAAANAIRFVTYAGFGLRSNRLIQYLLGEVQLPTIKNPRRNSDRDLRALERLYLADPRDVLALERYMAALRRTGNLGLRVDNALQLLLSSGLSAEEWADIDASDERSPGGVRTAFLRISQFMSTFDGDLSRVKREIDGAIGDAMESVGLDLDDESSGLRSRISLWPTRLSGDVQFMLVYEASPKEWASGSEWPEGLPMFQDQRDPHARDLSDYGSWEVPESILDDWNRINWRTVQKDVRSRVVKLIGPAWIPGGATSGPDGRLSVNPADDEWLRFEWRLPGPRPIQGSERAEV